MRRPAKKTLVLLTAVALVVIGAGTAFAFWTNTGSGSGSAATGATPSAVLVHQTSTVENLRPGGTPQTLTGNFDNPVGNGPVQITSVTVAIDSVAKAAGAVAGTCESTDYELTGSIMSVPQTIPEGLGVGAWTGATIQFVDKATIQDACKGAAVSLVYTIIN